MMTEMVEQFLTYDLLLKTGVVALLLLIVFLIGWLRGRRGMRKAAVEWGYAEFYLDHKYRKKWRWRNCECRNGWSTVSSSQPQLPLEGENE